MSQISSRANLKFIVWNSSIMYLAFCKIAAANCRSLPCRTASLLNHKRGETLLYKFVSSSYAMHHNLQLAMQPFWRLILEEGYLKVKLLEWGRSLRGQPVALFALFDWKDINHDVIPKLQCSTILDFTGINFIPSVRVIFSMYLANPLTKHTLLVN